MLPLFDLFCHVWAAVLPWLNHSRLSMVCVSAVAACVTLFGSLLVVLGRREGVGVLQP